MSRRLLESSFRRAFAGGQDEHPWDVNNSTTTGRSAASAATGDRLAMNASETMKRDNMAILQRWVYVYSQALAICYARLVSSEARTLVENAPVIPDFLGNRTARRRRVCSLARRAES